MGTLLMTVESMDRAEAIVRRLVRNDMLSIGITNWTYVNMAIRDRQHRYIIHARYDFDDVGNVIDCDGYEIWEKETGA